MANRRSYLNVFQDPESCSGLFQIQITILAAVSPAPLITSFYWVFGVVIVAPGVTPAILRVLRVEFFKTKRCSSVLMDDHDLVLIMGNFCHTLLVVLVEIFALRISGWLPLSANILSFSMAVVRLTGRSSTLDNIFVLGEGRSGKGLR